MPGERATAARQQLAAQRFRASGVAGRGASLQAGGQAGRRASRPAGGKGDFDEGSPPLPPTASSVGSWDSGRGKLCKTRSQPRRSSPRLAGGAGSAEGFWGPASSGQEGLAGGWRPGARGQHPGRHPRPAPLRPDPPRPPVRRAAVFSYWDPPLARATARRLEADLIGEFPRRDLNASRVR